MMLLSEHKPLQIGVGYFMHGKNEVTVADFLLPTVFMYVFAWYIIFARAC